MPAAPPPTQATPAAPAVEPIHTAVPGRARLRVRGLGGDGAFAALAGRLAGDPAILSLSANHRLGTLLVGFEPHRPLAAILDLVRRAARNEPLPAERGRAADRPWHAMPPAAVLHAVDGSGEGLARAEAHRRLAVWGRNRLPLPRRRSFAAILAGQFSALPVLLLAGSAVVSLMTGGAFEGLAVLAVVVVNGLIGATSESQAEGMIARLESRRRQLAVVRRGGRQLTVDAEEVVPGDVLLLSPGLTLPADARLLAADGLLADESVLTGESMPVPKRADDPGLAADTPLPDRGTMVWRGTLVAAGTGEAVTVATGRHTEIGRIQALVGDVARPQTPLQRHLDGLGHRLVLGSAVAAAAMVAVGLARGMGLGAVLRSGIALAVAAIPEGLPTVATLALAMAVRDLEARGVLVRRLEAVETMGSVATVFFDKTGTLTLNQMAVAQVRADGPLSVRRLWEVAALCSDASVEPGGAGGWVVEGSSTEAALVRAALAEGTDVPALRRAMPRLSERYRDDRRQSMATTHDLGGGRCLVAVKGSPAEVLAACSCRLAGDGGAPVALSDADRRAIGAANEAMAAEGLRVLGFASAEGEGAEGDGAGEERDLVWLGLVALSDPPRPGVEDFVAALHAAGLETVMLTGDQAATARSVALRLGFIAEPGAPVADSGLVETLDDESLAALASRTRVFARILPSHKLKVVRAYRGDGRSVAMVGDGVNDGPALKAADIGVTMGRRGSRAARDLSDLVLEEDDLRGLLAAVEQGRTTHDNIRKAVDFMLATNLSEIAVMLASTALGLGVPLGPAQLLWINLVTDLLPGLALSREAPEPDDMARGPRDPAAPLLDRAGWRRLAGQGAVLAAGPVAAHAWGLATGGAARAAALTSSTIVAGQMLHAYTTRSRRGTPPANRWLAGAVALTLAVQGAALWLPPLRRLLRLAPLGAVDLAAVAAAAVVPYAVNEAFKPGRRAAPPPIS